VAVRDVYFTYFLLGLTLLAAGAYGVRVAVRGVARSERVGRIGGTVLVGQELMDGTYWAVEPVVRACVALGITANGLTWAALWFGIGAGVAMGFGLLGLATLLSFLSTMLDIFDGQVARQTKTGSNRGELLDAAIDRYTEFAFIAGAIVYFYRLGDALPILLLALAALLASFMISYASAKAEALHVSPPRGLMRRHERAVYLVFGTGLSSLFGDAITTRFPELPPYSFLLVGLAIVAVVGNAAAIIRLVRIARAL
jgi:CDP-diacylglycerol--glycerol-3-phosphate 3-phosphatidyltransferase